MALTQLNDEIVSSLERLRFPLNDLELVLSYCLFYHYRRDYLQSKDENTYDVIFGYVIETLKLNGMDSPFYEYSTSDDAAQFELLRFLLKIYFNNNKNIKYKSLEKFFSLGSIEAIRQSLNSYIESFQKHQLIK